MEEKIERERIEKEKYQKKLEEMETRLSKLTTAPFSSTLQVNLNNLKFSPIAFQINLFRTLLTDLPTFI
jgi:hypothetical protein